MCYYALFLKFFFCRFIETADESKTQDDDIEGYFII